MRASSFDHEPVARIGGGAGGGHELRGVAVVEELRQRLGRGGMSPPMIGLRAGASGQSHSMIRSKNDAQHAQPLPLGVGRQRRALVAGLVGEPHLEVLDVVAADLGDRGDVGVGEQPAGELTQRVVGDLDAGGSQERRRLGEVAGIVAASCGA